MAEATRITRKGQTTIPQELRKKHGIEPGDTVVWEETDDGIVVRKKEATGARGMLAEGLSENERREIAAELGEEIREKREREWSVE
jgi:AbrB family looped-hinge helix DNA binding protein